MNKSEIIFDQTIVIAEIKTVINEVCNKDLIPIQRF